MKWDKESCPFCSKDDYKAWETTESGSSKRVKCDHEYDTDTYMHEMRRLAANILSAQAAYDETVKIYESAKEK